MRNNNRNWTEIKEIYAVVQRVVVREQSNKSSISLPTLPKNETPLSSDKPGTEPPRQRRERTGERVALLIVWGVVITWVVLAIKTLVTAGSSVELLEIIQSLWPYLIALLWMSIN